MNVLLACWDGDRLRPWVDGKYGWAYGSVRVAERLIARASEPSGPARKTAVEQLLQTLPNKGRWSVLLALDETPQGWIGEAWSAPTSHRPERLLKWVYDPLSGLLQIERTTAQDEEGE